MRVGRLSQVVLHPWIQGICVGYLGLPKGDKLAAEHVPGRMGALNKREKQLKAIKEAKKQKRLNALAPKESPGEC